jgi:hypothetical protein
VPLYFGGLAMKLARKIWLKGKRLAEKSKIAASKNDIGEAIRYAAEAGAFFECAEMIDKDESSKRTVSNN